MKYAEQRIPTLNEYCVVCDEQHVFQNGSMLKVNASNVTLFLRPMAKTASDLISIFLSSWVCGKGRILSLLLETLEISSMLLGKIRIIILELSEVKIVPHSLPSYCTPLTTTIS